MRRLQRLGHWLAGLGPGGFVRPACQRARWRCCTHRVRTTLSTLVAKDISRRRGRGCRNRACQVRSWSFEEAGLDLENRWKIGPFAHTCASVVGVSVDPSVVGRDWSPVSSNKARGYCCRTPGDHRAPLQPRHAARRYLRIRGTSRADFLVDPCRTMCSRWPTSELSPTCATAAWCGPITIMLAREVGALNITT